MGNLIWRLVVGSLYSLYRALNIEDRWGHRFNILWFSIVGFWLNDPVFFFMGMYLLTEYVNPAITPSP